MNTTLTVELRNGPLDGRLLLLELGDELPDEIVLKHDGYRLSYWRTGLTSDGAVFYFDDHYPYHDPYRLETN